MGLIVVMKGQERKPRYRCLGCGVIFFDGEESVYERHVVKCADKHDEQLRAESLRTRAPGIFDPHVSGDVELERWYRRNLPLLREGRKLL